MEYVDYYSVLDVDRSASADEISKSYKKLARKYHPDLNKNDDAESKFKELNEAYEVLKDPKTRKRFDTLGANWKHGAPFEPPPGWGGRGGGVHFDFGGGGPGGSGGFSDFFESIFGGARGQPGRGQPGRGQGMNLNDLFSGQMNFGDRRPRQTKGRDVESELSISLEDSFLGSKRTIELAGGAERRRYDVTIPRGIRTDEKIRLSGQGRPGQGGRPGDLFLKVTIAPHPKFQVEGDDLVVEMPIHAWDAALGCKVKVPTLDGDVTMTLPAGLSSGQRLRIKGKGMPRRAGDPGDLYAELKIEVPKELSREQERLFTKLKKIHRED